MYKGLDAKVLQSAIKGDIVTLEKNLAAAVTARIKDISAEKYA